MISTQIRLRNTLTGVGAGLALAVAGLSCAGAAEPGPAPQEDWSRMRQEWVQHRIDAAANRLEIKASQQAAWQSYVKALSTLTEMPAKPPAREADAAAMAKTAADRAAEFARRLKVVADATAKLQAVLTPEQRKTLDQIAHEAGERMMHHGMESMPGGGMHGKGMMEGCCKHGKDMVEDKGDHCERPGHEGGPMMSRPPMGGMPHDGAAPPPPPNH